MLVLVTMQPFSDLLVVALSTQLRHEVVGFDEVIDRDSTDFRISGLKKPSLIRLGLVATIAQSECIGRIGRVSEDRHTRLCNKLAGHISRV